MGKLKNIILNKLPNWICYPLIREFMDVNIEPPGGLEIKLASTKEELLESFRILHDAYVEHGYMKASFNGKRIIKHFCLPTTSIIVAKIDGKVVGTLSIIQRTSLKLPFENLYEIPEEEKKRRIAEVSSLAIDRNYRLKGGAIFLPMCKFFYQYVANYLYIDRVYISVTPQASKFYESILLFDRVTPKPLKYTFVDVSVVVLTADLADLKKRFDKVYSNKSDKKNLYKYFAETMLDSLLFPERSFYKFFDNILSAELITEFFVKESNILENMSVDEKKSVSAFLPTEQFQEALWGRFGANNVRGQRFLSKLLVDWADTIVDVSLVGLRAVNPKKITNQMWLDVSVSSHEIAKIQIEIVWIDTEQRQVGLKIIQSNDTWKDYISYLSDDFSSSNHDNNIQKKTKAS